MRVVQKDKKHGTQSDSLSLPCDVTSAMTQVAIDPITATAGSLAVLGRPWGSTSLVAIKDKDTGNPITVSLSDPDLLWVEGCWEEIVLDPTGVDGTYTAAYVNFA